MVLSATPNGVDLKGPCAACSGRAECLIGGLPADELARFMPLLKESRFAPGDALLEEGQQSEALKVIKVGTAMVLKRGRDGVHRAIGLFSRGVTLGKFGLTRRPDALSCKAITSGRLCVLRVSQIEQHQLFSEAFRQRVAKSTADAFTLLADWSQITRLPTATARLAGLLLQLADEQGSALVHLPAHAVVAELLGTRRETVARALSALVTRGAVVRRERSRYELDRDTLLQALD